MNRQSAIVERRPLPGPTTRHLAASELVDWHRHDRHQLVYPSSGVLRVSTLAGSWVVPPRRAVWLPAGVAHSHRAHGATRMDTVSFAADIDPFGSSAPTVVGVDGLARELILLLTREQAEAATPGGTNDRGDPPGAAAAGDRPGADGEERTLAEGLLLRRLRAVPGWRRHLPHPSDDRLAAVTAALTTNPADQRSLAELGQQVGAGERTLSRLFRSQTGMTFPQWRTQLRLQHALTMLATGASITVVAADCGFATPSAFSHTFREAFGASPSSYRRSLAPQTTAEADR